ncbi:MAG: glutathione peroxidase [Bacteroidales bacterium]|nr:glutathione peroxidase [Bacteroidales bacterium]
MKSIKHILSAFLVLSVVSLLSVSYGQTKAKEKQKEISSIYEAKMTSLDGEMINFSDYKGKVILIVNTASKCGFTKQYEALEELNRKYAEQGLVILGFPCNQFLGQEPGKDQEIKEFCTKNYGVDFQMFSKIDVNGDDAAPLYKFLKMKAPFEGFKNEEVGKQLTGILMKYHPEFAKGDEIKWNFTKFLVSKDGSKIIRYESPTEPQEMEEQIQSMF